MKRRWTQRRQRLYKQPDGTFKFTKPPKKKGKNPSFESAIKSNLAEKGVSQEWMKKHLIITKA